MKWQPSVNSAGYRGSMPEADYPSRETALALVAAIQSDAWSGHSELSRLAGVDDFSSIAQRCFMIYGHPELESVAVCRRISDVFMRPSARATSATPAEPTPSTSAPQDGYGFQRR